MRLPRIRRNIQSRAGDKGALRMLLRKSGANRVADLKIDAAAKAGAQAVRSAANHGATERFLSRFLDHLHTVDNARIELATRDESDERAAARRRRRRQPD